MAFLMQNTLVATFFLIALVLTPTSAVVCNGASNPNIGGVKSTLLNDLINDAVARSNHVSKLSRTGSGITLHGLATCDNGSSAYNCRNCLNSARGELNRCGNSVGGNAQIAGCTMRDHLENYTSDYTIQVLVGYCVVYIFMQTFMIPGTVFMSLLAGALFGVFKGVALVVFTATAGASSCYFLSYLIGKPLVFSLWPEKLVFFQSQVAKRRTRLLNYMVFLRVTPTLPNTFINVASPIVDVPYHIFLLATIIGLIPAAYVTVRAGIDLGELRSVGDLYDFNSIATLFLIGIVSITPTLMGKNES